VNSPNNQSPRSDGPEFKEAARDFFSLRTFAGYGIGE
jgi:hypothetical protein